MIKAVVVVVVTLALVSTVYSLFKMTPEQERAAWVPDYAPGP